RCTQRRARSPPRRSATSRAPARRSRCGSCAPRASASARSPRGSRPRAMPPRRRASRRRRPAPDATCDRDVNDDPAPRARVARREMNDSGLLLVIVVATALTFDFTNGFHDTANAMATSIATRALRPRVAVGLCALLNFAGAFVSIKVAATISQGIVDKGVLDLRTLLAALVGAIAWNLLTWAAGLPSSSTHALIGGL